MAWIDDRVWCHPKFTDLSAAAFRVYVSGLAYSSGFRCEGTLTAGQQKAIGSTKKTRAELVSQELWDDDGKAIKIRGWEEYNGKRDKRRKVETERKRVYRARQMSHDVPRDKDGTDDGTRPAFPRGRAPDEGSEGSEGSEKNSSSLVSSSDPALVVMVADDLAVVLEPEPEAAFQILSAIDKPGYHEPKFTRARFAVVVARHTVADLIGECADLADWETHGKGEAETTKDGIARVRNWLKRATVPLAAVPDRPKFVDPYDRRFQPPPNPDFVDPFILPKREGQG